MNAPPFIAIVDDDAAMREALDELLQVAGHATRAYAGAQAFLDDYAPGRFGLLITDLRMPQMDGIALLRRLAEMGADLPAIAVTSSDEAMRTQALAAGALACLAKPVDNAALLLLVDAAAGRDPKESPGD